MLSENIRKLRNQLGLTQTEFGKLFNKKHSTVGMWEQGRRQPQIKVIINMAEMAQTTVEEFMK